MFSEFPGQSSLVAGKARLSVSLKNKALMNDLYKGQTRTILDNQCMSINRILVTFHPASKIFCLFLIILHPSFSLQNIHEEIRAERLMLELC